MIPLNYHNSLKLLFKLTKLFTNNLNKSILCVLIENKDKKRYQNNNKDSTKVLIPRKRVIKD